MGLTFAAITALLYAATNVLVKKGVERSDRFVGVAVSATVNVVLLTGAVAVLLGRGELPRPSVPGVLAFLVAGLLTAFVARTFLYLGIGYAGAARSGTVVQVFPVVTIALAILVLGESLSLAGFLGAAVVLGGLGLLAGSQDAAVASPQPNGLDLPAVDARPPQVDGRRLRIGLLASLLAAASFGVGFVFRKVGLVHMPNAFVGAAIGSWAALPFAVAVAVARRDRRRHHLAGPWSDRYFWLSGVTSSLAEVSLYTSLLHAPASSTSVVVSSQSVLTVILAALYLRKLEVVTGRVVGASIAVFVGSAVIALAGDI